MMEEEQKPGTEAMPGSIGPLGGAVCLQTTRLQGPWFSKTPLGVSDF